MVQVIEGGSSIKASSDFKAAGVNFGLIKGGKYTKDSIVAELEFVRKNHHLFKWKISLNQAEVSSIQIRGRFNGKDGDFSVQDGSLFVASEEIPFVLKHVQDTLWKFHTTVEFGYSITAFFAVFVDLGRQMDVLFEVKGQHNSTRVIKELRSMGISLDTEPIEKTLSEIKKEVLYCETLLKANN